MFSNEIMGKINKWPLTYFFSPECYD